MERQTDKKAGVREGRWRTIATIWKSGVEKSSCTHCFRLLSHLLLMARILYPLKSLLALMLSVTSKPFVFQLKELTL